MPANKELVGRMERYTHTFEYTVYHRDELPQSLDALVEAASEATGLAYAPYSKFNVGAAARLEGGTLVRAANLENAAYPQCLCAEATLLGTLHTQYYKQRVEAIAVAVNAVVAPTEPAAPCGSCRQQLFEAELRQSSPIEIVLVGHEKSLAFKRVADLLPFGFQLLV